MTTDYKRKILFLCPCKKAIDWLGNRSVYAGWRACPRGDWLLWLAARIGVDRCLVVEAACDCAELGLQYVPTGEDRPRVAVETARAWARGEITTTTAAAARLAAAAVAAAIARRSPSLCSPLAAAAAASYAASYAAYRAYAASYAAAAVDVATYAVDAAAYAAYAADDGADGADAYTKTQNHCARLVRRRIPWRLIKAGLDQMPEAEGNQAEVA